MLFSVKIIVTSSPIINLDELPYIYGLMSIFDKQVPKLEFESPLQTIGAAKIKRLVGKILVSKPINRMDSSIICK